MSANTPERFREVEPLLNGDRAGAYRAASAQLCIHLRTGKVNR